MPTAVPSTFDCGAMGRCSSTTTVWWPSLSSGSRRFGFCPFECFTNHRLSYNASGRRTRVRPDFDGGALALGLGESGVEGFHSAEDGVDAPGETRGGARRRRRRRRGTPFVVERARRSSSRVVRGRSRRRRNRANRRRGSSPRGCTPRSRAPRARPERSVRHHPARPSRASARDAHARDDDGVAHQM